MNTPKRITVGSVYETNKNGQLIVLHYRSAKEIIVKFIATGYIAITSTQKINSGMVKDKMRPNVYGIGFIGAGEHKAKIKGRTTKSYQLWKDMMRRCYCEDYHKRQPTYTDCVVCEEWHNYQSFSDWYIKNEDLNIESPQLDKDIKTKGNKVYSPLHCSIVSRLENTIKAKAKKFSFISPSGVLIRVYNLSEFCRKNNLTVSGMSSVSLGKASHHKGWSKP